MSEEHEESSIHAAIYARVSTDEQAKGTSLESQVERCLAYAHLHGMAVHSAHVFRDEMSGAKALDERPVLMAVRELAKTKRIQAVIVSKIDRLSRIEWQPGFLIHEWEKAGLSFHTAEEPFENTKQGRFMRGMFRQMAEMERETIRERTTGGTRQRLMRGLPGGH
jgi:site-specific DNA recombinase